MPDYTRKTSSDNKHLSTLSSARFIHIDGSNTNPITIRSVGGRLLRVILNTNGATLTLKDGPSEVIGIIATDAPEGTFNYGVYCDNSIVVQASGAIDATIVFSD